MADSLTQINFQDIDYQGIKEGLITFLKTTQSLKDANFEGSFISELVNMFAYTGAIFGNYINAMASEQYIQTTQLYETANMLGHLVGYKAHGFQGAKTSLSLTPDFDAMGISSSLSSYYGWSAAFPRNTQFTTRTQNAKNKRLIFTNTTDAILTIKDPAIDTSNDVNTISLEVVQGIPMSIDFVSDGTSLQSFEIPNTFIDYKEIRVYVLNDSNKEELWTSALTWFYANSDSKIYIPFINPKGLLEIMFGEGNFGKIPEAGRTIRIEYFITTGASGNVDAGMIGGLIDNIYFVSSNYSDNILGNFIVTQNNASSEGLSVETTNRIKKFAPLYFGVQNRLVNEFDYRWFVLGEFNFLVDAKAFNYQAAVAAGLLRSPCQNEFINPRWASYTEQIGLENITYKIPNNWNIVGFYSAYTVIPGDELPLPPVNGSKPKVADLLNYGTTTALFADATRPCNDNNGAILSQEVSIIVNESCCTIIHFELEVMNPEYNSTTGEFPAVTLENLGLYINGEQCFTRIDKFIYNTAGYKADECCCEREGDIRGWYSVKGIAILDPNLVNPNTGEATITASIFVKPNSTLLLGEAKIYPASCQDANDVFVVVVPQNAGSLNIATKDQILSALNEIKMVVVRNHVLAPLYETFDVRVIFKKDETSIITIDEVANSLRAKIVEIFLPQNQTLGATLSQIEISNTLNTLPGVQKALVTLTPRSTTITANSFGDYQLGNAGFPVLGSIQLG